MVELGLYQHFKGGKYEVLGVARHSEDIGNMVVYKSLHDGGLWVRPIEMWNEVIERDGKTFLRFEKIVEE